MHAVPMGVALAEEPAVADGAGGSADGAVDADGAGTDAGALAPTWALAQPAVRAARMTMATSVADRLTDIVPPQAQGIKAGRSRQWLGAVQGDQ